MDPVLMKDLINNSSKDSPTRQLPPLDALQEPYQSMLVFLYTMTALVAFVLNLVAVLILLIVKRSSQDLRAYLANLAVADISLAMFSIPFAYTDFMFGRWIFPALLCPVVQFVQIMAVFVSTYTLIAIGIGRYFAIVYPLRNSQWLENRTALIIVVIWLLGIILGSPQLIQGKAVPFQYGKQTLYDCREQWEGLLIGKVYTTVVFIVTFILPFVSLTFIYGSIGITMIKRISPGNSDTVRDEVVKMLIILVISFALCWLPLQIFNLLVWLIDDLRTARTKTQYYLYVSTYFACHWLSMAHSFINPIIYCFTSKNFKKQDIKIVLRRLCPHKRCLFSQRNINESKLHLTHFNRESTSKPFVTIETAID